ncbi:hypothetical protein [Methanimicrococcus hacksteinii]|uniref:hypothetical protein n=1 Tax=Methanimicrococcus hacksteinii TaxID=3028293 RepID=UPI00298F0CDE|nr:hypothetical protein [Methanimicrococcus sp. At1]
MLLPTPGPGTAFPYHLLSFITSARCASVGTDYLTGSVCRCCSDSVNTVADLPACCCPPLFAAVCCCLPPSPRASCCNLKKGLKPNCV